MLSEFWRYLPYFLKGYGIFFFSKCLKGYGILGPPFQGLIYAPELRVQLIRIPHTSQSQRHDFALNACVDLEGGGGRKSEPPENHELYE